MLLNHRRALRVALAALVAAAFMCTLMAFSATAAVVQSVDDAFQRLMVSLRTPWAVTVAKVLAFVGSVWVNWPLRVCAFVLLAVKRRWLQLGAFALAVASSEVLLGSLKVLYGRPRPPEGLLAVSKYAFPSGHAVAAAVTAVGLVVVLLPPGPRRWAWELRGGLYAGLMALSRTYLSVHWLSDVVTGVLLGIGLAVGWPALLQELRSRRQLAVPADADQP